MTKFVDTLLQPISITEIIPFTEKTNVKNRTFLVLMDVRSLDTNIRQNEGILKLSVRKHMKISTKTTHTLLAGNARLILKENSFHFNGKHYLPNHGTAMGTKTSVLIPLPIFS